MEEFYEKETDFLIDQQACAVDAVKLEWLIRGKKKYRRRQDRGGNSSGHNAADKSDASSSSSVAVELSPEESMRLARIMCDRELVFAVRGHR